MDPETRRQAELFGGAAPWDEFEATLGGLPAPPGPEVMHDLAAAAALEPGAWVVDVGAYGFSHGLQLASAFGCRVVAVDLVANGLRSPSVPGPTLAFGVQGDAQRMPIASASVEAIWSRDMVTCVDPDLFLAECARILRPRGAMVLHAVYVTSLLEGNERERLVSALSLTRGVEREAVEGAAERNGLRVEQIVEVGGGWRERELITGSPRLAEDLHAVMRMLRAEEDLVGRFGRSWFETILAWRQWAPFMALGKLAAVCYLLRNEGGPGAGGSDGV